MVFQDYALFPHLDVAANVAYALGRRAAKDDPRVRDVLELVGLGALGARHPHELSGGQQQRVALARALAGTPDLVLLDEPFSGLDAALRARVRQEVRAILLAAGVTALFVTHDQEEALSLADRVAVMREGRIEQMGTPEEVYGRPASRWVAEFLGEADVLPGTVTDGWVECELARVPADPGLAAGDAEVLVRPESVALVLRAQRGRPQGARGGRRRARVLRPRPARARRAALRAAAALALAVVSRVAPRRPRPRAARRAGQRLRRRALDTVRQQDWTHVRVALLPCRGTTCHGGTDGRTPAPL